MSGNYTLTLTAKNSCGLKSTTIYVTVENCLGGGFYSVFPNPTTSKFTIYLKNDYKNKTQPNSVINDNYELFDFNANFILRGELKIITEVDVSRLKTGIYFLKIHRDNNIETHQVVIK